MQVYCNTKAVTCANVRAQAAAGRAPNPLFDVRVVGHPNAKLSAQATAGRFKLLLAERRRRRRVLAEATRSTSFTWFVLD